MKQNDENNSADGTNVLKKILWEIEVVQKVTTILKSMIGIAAVGGWWYLFNSTRMKLGEALQKFLADFVDIGIDNGGSLEAEQAVTARQEPAARIVEDDETFANATGHIVPFLSPYDAVLTLDAHFRLALAVQLFVALVVVVGSVQAVRSRSGIKTVQV